MLLGHFFLCIEMLECLNVWLDQFNWEHYIQVLQGINMMNLIMNYSWIVVQPQTVSFEQINSDFVCVLVVTWPNISSHWALWKCCSDMLWLWMCKGIKSNLELDYESFLICCETIRPSTCLIWTNNLRLSWCFGSYVAKHLNFSIAAWKQHSINV